MRIKFILIILSGFTSLNTLSQTFTLGQTFTGGFPSSVKFGDFDNDGDFDFVRTRVAVDGLSNLNASEIWFNDGNGNFTLHQSFGNTPSRDVEVGDLNGDGDLDLYIANGESFSSYELRIDRVWFNNGSGTFSNSGQLLDDRISTSVELADFDNDGDLDAFIGNSGDFNSECTVWLNDGNGQFTDSGQLLGVNNSNTTGLAKGDFDNDGDIDVAVSNCCVSPENTSVIWLNDGFANFTMGDQITTTGWATDLKSGDMNGDGALDLVFACTYGQSSLYLNDGTGNFSFYSYVHTNEKSRALLIGDYNLDGDMDLVISNWSNTIPSVCLQNDGNGNFVEVFNFPDMNSLNMAQVDVDNDLDIDLFMTNVNNEINRLWINTYNYSGTQNISICKGDSILINDQWAFLPETYVDSFATAMGGDSIVSTLLSVTEVDTSITASVVNLTANSSVGSFQWYDCVNENIIDGENSSSFSPDKTGSYAVIVTNGSCVDTSECYTISIEITDSSGINLENFPIVYPNPSGGYFTINLGETQNVVNIKIINLKGQKLLDETYFEKVEIPMNLNFADGYYLLFVETEQKRTAFSIVVVGEI